MKNLARFERDSQYSGVENQFANNINYWDDVPLCYVAWGSDSSQEVITISVILDPDYGVHYTLPLRNALPSHYMSVCFAFLASRVTP